MLIQDSSEKTYLSDINKINKSYYHLFILQKRIYQASKEGHLSLVRSLQKLLMSLNSINLLANNIATKSLEYSKIHIDKDSENQKKNF